MELSLPPNPVSGQHCENYEVKRETVHCHPRNVDSHCCTWSEVAWCSHWNLGAFFKIWFCFILLYYKSLNDWSLGEQWILFPSYLNVSLNCVSGNKIHSSLFSVKSHVLTEYFVLTKFAFLPGLHLHLVFLKWKVVCGTKVSKTKQAYICVLFNCCSLFYFNLLLCLFASSGIWWRFI